MYLNLLLYLYTLHLSFGDVNNKKFPDNFSFGVATAAYQVEGGWNLDKKGQSIWDNFTHQTPNSIEDGSNADVAANTYQFYEIDMELLKNLGVNHYRFSISWSRILPNGLAGNVNEFGIKYYQTLIKLLKENDIEPLVTIYHWDLPQHLQDLGGFLNDSFKDWFGDYARICFENFGDDVKYWITFNEPIYACYGYSISIMAPGIVSPAQGQYVCGHNLLKAHAAAWHIYNEEFKEKQQGYITLVSPTNWPVPASEDPEDIKAAETFVEFYLGYFSNPCYYGDYPEIMKTRIANRSLQEGFSESRLPEFTEEEKVLLKGTCDYYALNNYYSVGVKTIPEPDFSDGPSFQKDIGVETLREYSTTRQDTYDMLKYIQQRFNDPYIIITENGLGIKNNRSLEDDDRIEVIQNFLSGVRDAIDDNVQVVGYTVWCFLDTFEWALGYTMKFGLHDVDFDDENRTRTPRKSAIWYQQVISNRSLNSGDYVK